MSSINSRLNEQDLTAKYQWRRFVKEQNRRDQERKIPKQGTRVPREDEDEDETYWERILKQRVKELPRLFSLWSERLGWAPDTLPDVDAGREYLRILLHHVKDPVRMVMLCDEWAPWMPRAERDEIIEQVINGRRRFYARELAELLGLLDADRELLRIKTIKACDVTDEQREVINKAKGAAYSDKRRRARGIPTLAERRAAEAARVPPHEVAGLKEHTYYRTRKVLKAELGRVPTVEEIRARAKRIRPSLQTRASGARCLKLGRLSRNGRPLCGRSGPACLRSRAGARHGFRTSDRMTSARSTARSAWH